MRHFAPFALSLGVVAACPAPGDRAATGDCPAGETCSPLTPRGLSFQGLRFGDVLFDSGLHTTAVGSHQPIDVHYGQAGASLSHPYTPVTDDDAFVATASGPIVELAASDTATGMLRIVDVDGLLMDRIAIRAAAPAWFEMRAVGEQVEPGRAIALAPGRSHRLVVAELAADGTRLADADLRMTVTGATATVGNWDSVELAVAESASVALDVEAGGGLIDRIAIETRATADGLALQAHDPLAIGATTVVCATALAQDRQVLGLAWTWTGSTGVEVTPGAGLFVNCAIVTPRQASFQIAASVPGATATFSLAVGTARTKPAATPASDEGDRAQLVAW